MKKYIVEVETLEGLKYGTQINYLMDVTNVLSKASETGEMFNTNYQLQFRRIEIRLNEEYRPELDNQDRWSYP